MAAVEPQSKKNTAIAAEATTHPGPLRTTRNYSTRPSSNCGPAVVVGAPDYVQVDDCYVVRVFGDPGFVKFAITNQGYGEVVRELEELL